MTKIYCKSDCTFSRNEKRECTLTDIQLTQASPEVSQFTCGQYVKAEDGEVAAKLRYKLVERDVMKAREFNG